MNDIASVIGAIAAAMVPIGGAIAWIWNKFEQRLRSIETKLQECQDRESRHHHRRGVQLTVIELLWQEVSRNNPDAWVIQRAKRLLDDLKVKARED